MIETRDEIVKNMFNCNAKVNEEAGEGNSYRGRNELREDDFIDVEWSCKRVNDSFCYCILFFKTNKINMHWLFKFTDFLNNLMIKWLTKYDRFLWSGIRK